MTDFARTNYKYPICQLYWPDRNITYELTQIFHEQEPIEIILDVFKTSRYLQFEATYSKAVRL